MKSTFRKLLVTTRILSENRYSNVESMLPAPAILSAKRQGFKVLYVPPMLDVPIHRIKGIESRFVHSIEDVSGHEQAKWALEISAAGGHNVLMSGPPGCGKRLLSECYPSLLPNLSPEEQFEVLSIYQLAGVSIPAPHLPPHHSASSVA